jgi:hypothetical protein
VSFDFSGVTSTFWELRERGGLFNPGNLMRLVGRGLLPNVVENMLDAKVELDGRLRTVIQQFTDHFALKMTNSLPTSKPSLAPSALSASSPTPALKPSALPQARQAVHQTCKAIEKEVPDLRRVLDAYLPDTRTKETLVGSVQDRVLQIYEEFFEAYMAAEKAARAKAGKARADDLWDVDTFADWCEGVFRVGVAASRSDDDDDDKFDGDDLDSD